MVHHVASAFHRDEAALRQRFVEAPGLSGHVHQLVAISGNNGERHAKLGIAGLKRGRSWMARGGPKRFL